MSTYTFLGSSATAAVTSTGAAAIGALVNIVVVGSSVASAISDGANTYTRDAGLTHATFTPSVAIFSARLTTPVTTSTTFTATGAGTNPGIAAFTCSNPVAGTMLDFQSTAQSVSSGTAVSSGSTVSPATSDEFQIAVISTNGTGTVTPQAGYTEDVDVAIATTRFETQARILTSTTAVNATGTLSVSASWCIATAVYKLTSGVVTAANNLALLGVG